MSSRKQRELLRLRRIAFDLEMERGWQEEDFDKMTKAQLVEYAAEKGIEVDKKANKADMLDAIKKAIERSDAV